MATAKKRAAEHVQQVYIRDRRAWRRWLSTHHDKEQRTWLVYDKPANGGKLSYDDIVEEALCWDWIDSRQRSKDDWQSMLYMSRRKKGSTWSKSNKERIERLIESGLMTEHGFRAIEEAKADGSWNALDAIDNLDIPPDLQAALSKNRAAKRHFEACSPSTKKQLLYHILNAKQEGTRKRRIEQILASAAEGRNPLARSD
jgi:uncharacterized protein YdeI (YjbR/CyaY-like superfamily)